MGIDYFREKDRAWVLSSWQVDGGQISEDWEKEIDSPVPGLPDSKGLYGHRNFCMQDEEGEIGWHMPILSGCYMDMKKGRPVKA